MRRVVRLDVTRYLVVSIARAAALAGLSLGCLWLYTRQSEPVLTSRAASTAEASERPTTSTTLAISATLEDPPTTSVVQNTIFVSIEGRDATDRGRSLHSPVRTAEFAAALSVDGDTIIFGDGNYAPLTLEGKSGLTITSAEGEVATFTGGAYEAGAGITIRASQDVLVANVRITNSLWGIVIERSNDIRVDGVTVVDIGQEGISVGGNSFDIEVVNNSISETGRRSGSNDRYPYSTFGEGVYIGTGGLAPDGTEDRTHDVLVHRNRISFTTAEAIDVKPSVYRVTISDNVVHDVSTATSGAIVVGIGNRIYPDPEVVIERNILFRVSTTSQWNDGIGIRVSAPAVVRHNIVIDAQHYGILVDRDATSATAGHVVIEGNAVIRSGVSAIENQNSSDSVLTVEIKDNLLGTSALELLEPLLGDESERGVLAIFEAFREGTLQEAQEG